MSKTSADWIKTKGRKNLKTYCERCGDSFVTRLPVSVSGFAATVTAFVKVHRKCTERSK